MQKQLIKNVNRLNLLRKYLKNAHSAYWRAIDSDREPSARIYGWIDDYNELRHKEGWKEYCSQHGSHVDHDAIDLFA